jgi:hypothetical protein
MQRAYHEAAPAGKGRGPAHAGGPGLLAVARRQSQALGAAGEGGIIERPA